MKHVGEGLCCGMSCKKARGGRGCPSTGIGKIVWYREKRGFQPRPVSQRRFGRSKTLRDCTDLAKGPLVEHFPLVIVGERHWESAPNHAGLLARKMQVSVVSHGVRV